MSNGELYSWGEGQFGATGLSTQSPSYAPMKVVIGSAHSVQPQYILVSAGKRHTLAIDSHGSVYVCGDNSYRQLGILSNNEVMALKQLTDFNFHAKQVAAGSDHSLILTEDGRVYAAGNNQNGNLGLGHNYAGDKFQAVNGLSGLRFQQISAGRHSAALTDDNRLFVWGQAFVCEKALLLPQELRSNKQIRWISVGDKSSAIIDEDSHLYTWGSENSKGQLGVPKTGN
jgi:X-linked retinitis pigmentosa GTPase regulator